MKKILLAIFSTLAVAGAAQAQSQATFQWQAPSTSFLGQTNSTAYSPFEPSSGTPSPAGGPGLAFGSGTFPVRYELLTSSNLSAAATNLSQFSGMLATAWLDTGLTMTNTVANNGRMIPPSNQQGSSVAAITNWAAGSTQNAMVVGWSANLGTNWAQALSKLTNWPASAASVAGTAWFGINSGSNAVGITAFNVNPGSLILGPDAGLVNGPVVLRPLNPGPPITITTPLTNQTFAAGSPLALSVSASSSSPLSYQWSYNNSPIPGATDNSVSWNPALTNYSGVFQVLITNQAGVFVTQTATVVVYQVASIITPPSGLLVSYGDPATFYVNAIGFPSLAYQWALNGTNIANATNSTYSIGSVNMNNLGNYSVLVTNAFGWSNSLPVALTMLPSLVNPFSGSSGLWGQPDTLNVGAVGSGTLTYQWFKDGVAISGATTPSYYLPSLQFTNSGSYYVVVSSTYGSVTNAAATLNVRPSDLIFGQYAGITVQGTVGNAYLIQYSTDLVNWTTATNVTMTAPTFQWADFGVDMRFNPGRYYQVIPTP
jgi:hypothetical protein